MSASFESRKNSQATMITVGFAGLILLLMFLVSWTIPIIEQAAPEPPMFVELNIPDEEVLPPSNGGGGGGGNTVEAAGPKGTASYSPPDPGTKEDAKDIEDNPAENTPPILKPVNPKPDAKKINENKSVTNPPPKPDPIPPAPPRPKATMGKTTGGSGTGGGSTATTYDRPGGNGTGYGVGNGSGTGGGQGTGAGGGRGSGVGPRVTSGDRSVVGSYSFQGDLPKATIYAHVRVSPDGTGEFIQFAKQSTATSSDYKNEIISYLRKMRFNKSDHESMVTVQFNFRVNG